MSTYLNLDTITLLKKRGSILNKKVLLLCKDNSALSIIAEAILNKNLADVDAQSASIQASKPIHPAVKKALIKNGAWSEKYKSKKLDTLMHQDFDLVIILDASSTKKLPDFSEKTAMIEIEYETPNYENSTTTQRFIKTLTMELIPITRDILEL